MDRFSMGRLVEMKIHYRKPTLLEQMDQAITDAGKKRIDYFEITNDELNFNYSKFDRSTNNRGEIVYSYKGITIKVTE
jgi:hypothetical protein